VGTKDTKMKKLLLLLLLGPLLSFGQFFNFSTTNGLVGYNVQCFKEDINGNLWIGTSQGLSFNDSVNFTNYTTNDGLISNNIIAIEIDATGKVWIGTSSGLSVFDGFSFTNYSTTEGLIGNNVKDIQKDVTSNIWVATSAGISVFNGFTFVNYTTAYGLPTNSIWQIEMDDSGTIWIGSMLGLTRFDNPGFTTFSTANGMPTNSITILEAKDNVYMKGGGAQICVYDGTTFTTYGISNGLPSGMIRGISVDADTNIWIAYSDKLIRFDTLNVDYYSSNNTNLPSIGFTSVYSIANNILLGTQYNSYFCSANHYISTNDHDTLMINNINALVNSNGILFRNPYDVGSYGFFEVPAGSGKNSNFISTVWLGGIDQNNIFHVVGGQAHQNSDWAAGPISTNYNTYEYDSTYNRVWKINKSDIDYHIQHWNDTGYVVPRSILEWPDIAEYLDSNMNSIYDPDSGDYPLIMGDQAILAISNDDINDHTLGRNKMQAEVHSLVYGYNDPSDSVLYNTVFVQFKIKNRSVNDYNDVYMGIYDWIDIGDWLDDYFGVDTATNSFYIYNGDNYDNIYGAHTPAQGVAFLSSKMTSAAYSPINFPYPYNTIQYFNILNGYWPDGTPYTYGGNGYGGTTPVDYVLSGNPQSTVEWNETNTGLPPGDREGVGVVGPFTLDEGQEICIDVAYVNAIAYDGDNLLSAKYLLSRMQYIQWWKSQNPGLSCDSIITIPNSNMSIFAQDTAFCANHGDITLYGIHLDGVYPFTYQWADSLGSVFSTDENPVTTLPANSPTNYYVTITDVMGFTATDTLTVIVNPLPLVSLGTYSNLCSGDTVTIDISGYSDYEWSNGNSTGIVNLTISGLYSVTVTDQYGCTAEDTTTITFIPNTINLNDITPSCVGDYAIIDAGSGFSSYLWSTGDTTQDLLVNTPFSDQATYSLTVTTSNGCEFTDSTIVDVTAPYTYLGNDTSIFSNETLNLNPGNYVDYLWSDASTNPINVFDGSIGSGIYTLWVETTDYFGCVSSDTIQITVTLWIGIEEMGKNNVQLYPNPTTGLISVKAEGIENIKVLNLQGKEIYSNKETELDLSQQPKGLYIIKVITDKQTIIQKLIKQ